MDFATFLMDLSHGDVNKDLGEKLQQVIEAVEKTGKAGAVTAKFSVGKEGSMAVVHCDVTTKVPTPALPGTMFFWGKEPGEICREDPRQMNLKELWNPPQVVKGGEAE